MESAVAQIMKKNWFHRVESDTPFRWTFAEDARRLPDKEMRILLGAYLSAVLERPDVEVLSEWVASIRNAEIQAANHTINIGDVATLLQAMTMSEYYFDALVYLPPELRRHRLEGTAKELDWSVETILRVDDWWARNRQRLMAAASQI